MAMSLAAEQHYSPQELAALWGLSDEMIRRMFADEPGILLIGEPSRRVGRRLVRGYQTMRIPRSVSDRVHERLRTRRRH
jgi:hypothetical protein